MQMKKVTVTRFDSIPGVGARIYQASAEAPQASNENDLLEVFNPNKTQQALIQSNGSTVEAWQWSQIVTAVNDASIRETRSQLVGSQESSGKVIDSFKKAVYSMTKLFTTKSKEECAQMLLTQDPSMREALQKEGIEFGDVDKMRKQFKE